MELFETMLKRRSVRKYTDENIPQEKIDKILQAGLLAPTSRNFKPCEFYAVRDKETLKKLSKSKKAGAAFLADSNAAIVVFGDSKKSDTWVEDCSVALTYMLLAAVDQGVGACWVQIHLRTSLLGKSAEDNVREILSVHEHLRPLGILSLGIPEKEAEPHTVDETDRNKLHFYDNQGDQA